MAELPTFQVTRLRLNSGHCHGFFIEEGCVKVCLIDPSAVNWASEQDKGLKRAPVYDYDACIRCYCCQEMCPERAIDIKVPPLGRLIHG